MSIKLNKIKTLKKFNLYTFYGFTNKLNLYYYPNKKQIIYKLIKNLYLLKILYNLKNKKIKKYINFNIHKIIILLKTLNLRADSVLFNSNLFITLNSTRQHILHKHILLNNKIIINCSYVLKNNDILHILNLNFKTLTNIIIYNYIIKNLKINILNNKIFKFFKYRKYIKYIIMHNNYTIFNIISCYKNFKIKINLNNDINSILNNYIIHF